MIVFDLICTDLAHRFEGWFSSSNDFEQQKSSGLLVCPVCNSPDIVKAVMAPNVGLKGNQGGYGKTPDPELPSTPVKDEVLQATETNAVQVPAEYKEILGKLAKAQTEILEKSEWVGDKFSKEARAIHYGDSEEKAIHGTATPEEAIDLEDEGIELTPLPFPVVSPESQN